MSIDSFAKLIADRERDAHSAARNVGYLRAILDESIVGEKLAGSLSGRALTTASDAVLRITALYCARSWEKKGDLISIWSAFSAMPSDNEVVEHQRRLRGHTDVARTLMRTGKRRLAALEAVHAAAAMPLHPYLEVMRAEWIAHRIDASRPRKRLEKRGIEVRGVMHKDIRRMC